MKKLWAILLAASMLLTMTACGGTESESSLDGSANVIEEPDDLIGKRVGVQLGTTGDLFVTEDYEDQGTIVERYNKGMDAVQALQQGKIDAVVIDNQPAQVFVAQNDDIRVIDEAYRIEDYAICLKKGNTELLEQMNTAIAELKEDGTLQQLLDYYIEQKEGAEPYTSPEGITYDGTLVMATNAEFPPYEYHEGQNIVGLDVDFARAICDKLGKELVIEDMAFDSILFAIQSGKADFGAAGMTVNEERKQSVDFTDSYCTGYQVIIVRK